jgi:hypothetical protein
MRNAMAVALPRAGKWALVSRNRAGRWCVPLIRLWLRPEGIARNHRGDRRQWFVPGVEAFVAPVLTKKRCPTPNSRAETHDNLDSDLRGRRQSLFLDVPSICTARSLRRTGRASIRPCRHQSGPGPSSMPGRQSLPGGISTFPLQRRAAPRGRPDAKMV